MVSPILAVLAVLAKTAIETFIALNFSSKAGRMTLLLGLLLRIRSMNELKFMIKENEFAKAFPRGKALPQIDTIRDTLKVININGLKVILHHVVTTAIKNKAFANGTIDGYTVAAIDGTKFFGSNKKSCPECLSSKDHHYHSGVVMSTIGGKPRVNIYNTNATQ